MCPPIFQGRHCQPTLEHAGQVLRRCKSHRPSGGLDRRPALEPVLCCLQAQRLDKARRRRRRLRLEAARECALGLAGTRSQHYQVKSSAHIPANPLDQFRIPAGLRLQLEGILRLIANTPCCEHELARDSGREPTAVIRFYHRETHVNPGRDTPRCPNVTVLDVQRVRFDPHCRIVLLESFGGRPVGRRAPRPKQAPVGQCERTGTDGRQPAYLQRGFDHPLTKTIVADGSYDPVSPPTDNDQRINAGNRQTTQRHRFAPQAVCDRHLSAAHGRELDIT